MKSKSISEEKQETGGDSDSRHVPSYPFEPEADDSEIVTAKRFSSKSVSSPVPYFVACYYDSYHQKNIHFICLMYWCDANALSYFIGDGGGNHERKCHLPN